MCAKKKTQTRSNSTADELSFEQAAEKLEAIAEKLETGQCSLDESLAAYEQGVQLYRRCIKLLDHAKLKIDKFTGIQPNGDVETEPFDDDASTMDDTGRSRAKKRSAKDDHSTLF